MVLIITTIYIDLLFYFPSRHLDRSTTLTAAKAYGYVLNGYDGELTIIAKVEDIEKEKIDYKESLTDQGADSLDMISIIFAFQEKYGVEITDESIAAGEWLSIEKMVTNLDKVLLKKQGN